MENLLFTFTQKEILENFLSSNEQKVTSNEQKVKQINKREICIFCYKEWNVASLPETTDSQKSFVKLFIMK